jgi:hypothetical protein
MIGNLVLTADYSVVIKDDNGNPLGSVKLDTDGSLLFYPSGHIEVFDNPLVVAVRTRSPDSIACQNTACTVHVLGTPKRYLKEHDLT